LEVGQLRRQCQVKCHPAPFAATFPRRDTPGIFTALLALLIKVNPSDSRVLGEQQSQLASYQRQFDDLNEEHEWTMRLHSNYYGYSLIQKYVTGSSALATVTT
jgi:hypothetical protein